MVVSSRNSLVLVVMILKMCEYSSLDALKCYQCSTEEHFGCNPYELKLEFLKECPVRGGKQPACRTLSQVHFFTSDSEMLIRRECAYMYNEPLGCERSDFHSTHYSMACECNIDGCNAAVRPHPNLFSGFIVVQLFYELL